MAPNSSNKAVSGTVGIALRSARGLLERRVLKPAIWQGVSNVKEAASQGRYHEATRPEFCFAIVVPILYSN